LKIGAVGLSAEGKPIVGTDASCASACVKLGWTVNGNKAKLFEPTEGLENKKL
jgi:hypothetical protein